LKFKSVNFLKNSLFQNVPNLSTQEDGGKTETLVLNSSTVLDRTAVCYCQCSSVVKNSQEQENSELSDTWLKEK